MEQKKLKSSDLNNTDQINGGDGCYFTAAMEDFKHERSSAISKNITVTYIEGNTIYKTNDGITKHKISEVKPLVKVAKRTVKIG